MTLGVFVLLFVGYAVSVAAAFVAGYGMGALQVFDQSDGLDDQPAEDMGPW